MCCVCLWELLGYGMIWYDVRYLLYEVFVWISCFAPYGGEDVEYYIVISIFGFRLA